jgi:primosomal protein N' (replication factor Y)
MCHYCGHSEEFSNKCPVCGEAYVRASGFGTQRVEQELLVFFPEARVLRMDADTTMSRFAHEDYLTAFAAEKYDILLGTQMVAKGLDFPNVTLAGVINADGTLFADDYRGYERTFSLLTQVVGRSGRGGDAGTAVVQTVQPENPVITLAARQDYPAFYKQEILTRKLMKYPPFCDLCVIGFSAPDEKGASTGAMWTLTQIKTLSRAEFDGEKLIVLGPSPAAVPRVNGKYRVKLVVKCRNSKRFRAMMAKIMREFGQNKAHKEITAFIEMKPYTIV